MMSPMSSAKDLAGIPYFVTHEVGPGRWRASTELGYFSGTSEEDLRAQVDRARVKVTLEPVPYTPGLFRVRRGGTYLDAQGKPVTVGPHFVRSVAEEIVRDVLAAQAALVEDALSPC